VQKVLDELDLDFQEQAPAAGKGRIGAKEKEPAEEEEEEEKEVSSSSSSSTSFPYFISFHLPSFPFLLPVAYRSFHFSQICCVCLIMLM